MFETFQLSNDAFYYLKNGEEPLVDEALDEALVIEALYPDGFTILDFKPLGDTGYIEARIGPKIIAPIKTLQPTVGPTTQRPQDISYNIEAVERNRKEYADSDEVQMLSKICRLEIVWLNTEHTQLKAYWNRLDLGQRTVFGEFPVELTPKGLKYFQKTNSNGTFCRFYLKFFNKVVKS